MDTLTHSLEIKNHQKHSLSQPTSNTTTTHSTLHTNKNFNWNFQPKMKSFYKFTFLILPNFSLLLINKYSFMFSHPNNFINKKLKTPFKSKYPYTPIPIQFTPLYSLSSNQSPQNKHSHTLSLTNPIFSQENHTNNNNKFLYILLIFTTKKWVALSGFWLCVVVLLTLTIPPIP